MLYFFILFDCLIVYDLPFGMQHWKLPFGESVDLAMLLSLSTFKYNTNALIYNRSLTIFFAYAIGDLHWQILVRKKIDVVYLCDIGLMWLCSFVLLFMFERIVRSFYLSVATENLMSRWDQTHPSVKTYALDRSKMCLQMLEIRFLDCKSETHPLTNSDFANFAGR